jgi:hypothetical protein
MSEQHTSDKQKQKQAENDREELSLGKVSFGDKKLEFYFDIIKYPIILATVINVVYFFVQDSFEVMWIFDILAFIYIAMMVIKKKQGGQKEVFIACGIAGLFMGLFIAIFKFIYFQKFYLFFNLVSEPFLTFFIGGFVGIAVAFISLKLYKKNKKEISSTKKGGD